MFLTNLQVSVTYPLSLKIEDLEERTTMSNGKAIFFAFKKIRDSKKIFKK